MKNQSTGARQGIVARLSWGRMEARRRRPTLGDQIIAAVGRDFTDLLEQLERRTLTAAQIEALWTQLEEDVAELIAASAEHKTAVKASADDLLLLSMSLYNLDAVHDQLRANLDTYEELLKRTNPRLPAVPKREEADAAKTTPTSPPASATASQGTPPPNASPSTAAPADAPPAGAAPSPPPPTGFGARARRTQPRLTPDTLSHLAKELEKTYADLVRMASRIETTLRNARTPSRFVLRGAIEQCLVLITWLEEKTKELRTRYFTQTRIAIPMPDPWSRVVILVGSGLSLLAFVLLPWLQVRPDGTAGDAITPLGLLLDHSHLGIALIQAVLFLASGAGVSVTYAFRRGKIAFNWALNDVMAAVQFAQVLTRITSAGGLLFTLVLLREVQALLEIQLPVYASLSEWGAILTLAGFVLTLVGSLRRWYRLPSRQEETGASQVLEVQALAQARIWSSSEDQARP